MKYSLSHNRYYYAVFLLVYPYLFILNMLSNQGQLINIPSTNNTLAGLITQTHPPPKKKNRVPKERFVKNEQKIKVIQNCLKW